MYLFINATNEDFDDIENYVARYINYLEDKTLDSYSKGVDIPLTGIFENDRLEIVNKKQSIMMETPNKIEFAIKSKEDEYKLPEISYAR